MNKSTEMFTTVMKHNELTSQNMHLAMTHNTWGTPTAGKNTQVKKDKLVSFALGVSIHNLDELKQNEKFKEALKGFPNLKNVNITEELLENIEFHIEKMHLGKVTSSVYTDESKIWEPIENKRTNKKTGEVKTKKNFYANRFKWEHSHTKEDFIVTALTFGTDYIHSLILSLRDKYLAPATISHLDYNEFLEGSAIAEPSTEDEFQDSIQDSFNEEENEDEETGGKKKTGKIKPTREGGWERDPKVSAKALKIAKHQCEIDPSHVTFTSKATGKNYTEAHHLIPMSYQGLFEYSIDVPQNVVSLCSICHHKIHRATDEQKVELIEKLYEERKEKLKSRKIKVSLDNLKSYYNI